MKAAYYFTLLDGLLATAVYHPHNPGEFLAASSGWSAPLDGTVWTPPPTPGATVTLIDRSAVCVLGPSGEKGMGTSATPVCGFRTSLEE